ncbi:MAG: 23S rRNA (guanosine(2251)-2'-O)-methyltransferase RlmB [Desulfuromonadales bacterium C00003094]|nr:MAG: 23S rRNA (guanosine(2251)-2'-O)-methyltransferase RlmB [Desulfuromonadales bacterium C00003094]OEU74226.1 MAG: 23S rRNA (guanosine(2251)-2'-O)-methyltransferase RlmB [Desulfuromonadales bacterium C00003107]
MADLIYGINTVSEGLRSSRRRPLALILQRDSKSTRLVRLQREAEGLGITVSRRDRRELDRLVGHGNHQGALLEVEPFAYLALDELLGRWRASKEPAFFLILDGITDPHNLGAILRSADGAGCHGVIVAKDRACPVTGVVDKVSAGALEHVPLCQVTNLARTIDALRKEGVWVYGLAGEEGASSLYATDLRGDLALVVGSEGTGLRPNTRTHCDLLLAIPLCGKVSSLNASVATSVALFEAGRQRNLTSSSE